ncbi:hypothetical protein [Campylobacter sp. RM16187]|uniref:hypothetical protein n=1 Tax=Campylobacter sp. RM16187 TaxID=1660063 RepID=UPI0021B5CC9C|nr:hypothetical protein [Campylobacter sp. RM16187]QKG29724.1 hypothetical protein CDOMF_1486 [Campylobacter sp. RM16187]
MAIPKITQELTPFGPAPQRTDPKNFPTRADATVKHFLTHLDEQNTMSKQYNASIDELNTAITDIDNKYQEVVDKHTDFIPKYNDAVKKHDQIVTMHKEVEADTSHVDTRKNEIDAIKTHIDETKTQIDADLTTAKSMINEGNGGVIDDTKNSDVSTWSSNELQRRLDLKADEATAYKEWNYKRISDNYTAFDNDAIFIEANKTFNITLPESGKIKIVDKNGTLSQHNVKLITGDEVLVLNKDFQRVELFKFDGKWQVVSGYVLAERNEHSVTFREITFASVGFFSGNTIIKTVGNILYQAPEIQNISTTYTPRAINLDTMTNILPAMPTIPAELRACAVIMGNGLFIIALSTTDAKMFRFDLASGAYIEIDATAIRNVLNATDLSGYSVAILNRNYGYNDRAVVFFRTPAPSYSYGYFLKIEPDGTAAMSNRESGNSNFYMANDFLFDVYGNTVRYALNLRDMQKISGVNSVVLNTTDIQIDYPNNKLFFAPYSGRLSAVEWVIGGTPTVVTYETADNLFTKYYDELIGSKQGVKLKKAPSDNILNIEYDTYINNRKTRKQEATTLTDALISSAPVYVSETKDIYVANSNKKILEITYAPTTFQEEV